VTSEFFVGQRWVSNTEPDLGLGIVVAVENRRVELSFPAAAERRTYAFNNAPLSRVIYHVDESFRHESGASLTVKELHENNGCLIYLAVDEQGEEQMVPELDLDSFVQFSRPQDRLFAGQVDKLKAFQLRYETLQHVHKLQQAPVTGLLGPRVQLLPHQLYIAHEVANRYAPRVLLADEVGLGKTIEAGLVIHQQLISGRANRVLIVVPDSLLHQWLVEMLRRFNLSFTILDEERCEALDASAEGSPFDSAQLVLCKLSLFTEQPLRLQQAAQASWDLLVVDEAHHLEWHQHQPSAAYQAIEALAYKALGLLLLTATPEQLGVESHFARLRLLDPDRYHDYQRFLDEEAQYQPVNELIQQLISDDAEQQLRQQPQLLEQLRHYLGDDEVDHLQSLLNNGEAVSDALKELIKSILDRHGTGRVLFRNTRASVSGFPVRHLHSYPLVVPELMAAQAASISIDEALHPEKLLGDEWWQQDSRVRWLVSWLREHRKDKVLLICANANTALDLEAYLRLRQGVGSAVFHEGLSLIERDRAAAYFADPEDGAQLLVCSEIGSEGRNFQFSHHLVLFDLPLNPDLLEQRIGRLDRIGQQQDIQLHVPYYENSAQAVLLDWYQQGLNAFEKTCPAAQTLYQQHEQNLLSCLQLQQADEVAELIAATQKDLAVLLEKMQQGRDCLLELNSCDNDQAEHLIAEMTATEQQETLAHYMEQVFDQFGVDQEHHSASSIVIRPSDHMRSHDFPGLSEEGLTATYYRDMALSRDDVAYMTWEHPMVRGSMDMILSSEFGNTAFCTMKLPPLKEGSLLLEAVFTVQCPAPAELQLSNYLPLTPVRVVVDVNKKNLTQVLTNQHFNQLGKKVPRQTSQQMIRHARAEISEMISAAEKIAKPELSQLSEQALNSMRATMGGELSRMEHLKLHNPNIRQGEIDYLTERKQQLQHFLSTAQLKLDSIRVGLVVNK
jgi:ATP-dependent helicase HepA